MERPRLLVVDDDSYTRAALGTILGARGWQVALAGTLAEGLIRIEDAPACVILGLNLPDGRGEDLLRVIRTRHPRTRVAVCSGVIDPARLAVVHELGPEILLLKPIEMAPIFRLCESVRAYA